MTRFLRSPNAAGWLALSRGAPLLPLAYLSVVLKYAGAAWADCFGVKASAITDAKPYLRKQGLIAMSLPRERRPMDDEIATLDALLKNIPHGRPYPRRTVRKAVPRSSR